MQVGMQLEATQQVGVTAVTTRTEGLGVQRLEALPDVGTQRQVHQWIYRRERQVLEVIERLSRYTLIRQRGPVFLPAVEQWDRTARNVVHRRRLLTCGLHPTADAQADPDDRAREGREQCAAPQEQRFHGTGTCTNDHGS